MDGEDRSNDAPLDPLFSYPQMSSNFHPPTSSEGDVAMAVNRGSSPAPRVGLPRPPPSAPPVASVHGGTAAGRPGLGAGRTGTASPYLVATDGQAGGAQATMPQATANQLSLASASRKRPPSGRKRDDQDAVCEVCGDTGNERLVLCCSDCKGGHTHQYCLPEVLFDSTLEDWFCDECNQRHKEGSQRRSLEKVSTERPSNHARFDYTSQQPITKRLESATVVGTWGIQKSKTMDAGASLKKKHSSRVKYLRKKCIRNKSNMRGKGINRRGIRSKPSSKFIEQLNLSIGHVGSALSSKKRRHLIISADDEDEVEDENAEDVQQEQVNHQPLIKCNEPIVKHQINTEYYGEEAVQSGDLNAQNLINCRLMKRRRYIVEDEYEEGIECAESALNNAQQDEVLDELSDKETFVVKHIVHAEDQLQVEGDPEVQNNAMKVATSEGITSLSSRYCLKKVDKISLPISQLQEENKVLAPLRERMASADAEHKTIEIQRETLKTQAKEILELRSKIVSLEQEKIDLQFKNNTMKTQCQDLQIQVEEISGLKSQVRDLGKVSDEKAGLEAELKSARPELEKCQIEVKSLRERIRTLEEEVAWLGSEERHEAAITAFEVEQDKMIRDKSAHDSEVKTFHVVLEKAKSQVESYKSQLKAAKLEKKAAVQKLKTSKQKAKCHLIDSLTSCSSYILALVQSANPDFDASSINWASRRPDPDTETLIERNMGVVCRFVQKFVTDVEVGQRSLSRKRLKKLNTRISGPEWRK